MMNVKKRKSMRLESLGDKVAQTVIIIIFLIFSLIILFPLFNVVITSLTSQAEYARRGSFIMIPEEWDFTAYKLILGSGSNIWNGYKNTLFVVLVGTACNMLVTIPMAYALSKKQLKGRKVILAMILFTMMFSGGMIPNYLLVNYLGLLDSRWSLVLPTLVNAWNMIILRNFFYSIPESIEESAMLDGASRLQTLVLIIIPLSMPSIATISLWYAVAHWNSWFNAVLYINNNRLLPVQNILRNILIATSAFADLDPTAWNDLITPPSTFMMRSATIVVSTLPILVSYPFVQKYFVKGVMVGSIKG
jgi:putative aldouronate transport system permease protein